MNALQLSRKQDRSQEETEFLYTEISNLAVQKEYAMLFRVFLPAIKLRVSWFKERYYFVSYSDLINDSYIHFVTFVDKYREGSGFSYYFKRYFYSSLSAALAANYKCYKYENTYSESFFSNTIDARYDFERDVFLSEVSDSISNAVSEFSNKKISRISDSRYNQFFIEGEEIPDIANKLGISYHAVYQTITTMIFVLSQHVNNSKVSGYTIDTQSMYKAANGKILGSYKIISR